MRACLNCAQEGANRVSKRIEHGGRHLRAVSAPVVALLAITGASACSVAGLTGAATSTAGTEASDPGAATDSAETSTVSSEDGLTAKDLAAMEKADTLADAYTKDLKEIGSSSIEYGVTYNIANELGYNRESAAFSYTDDGEAYIYGFLTFSTTDKMSSEGFSHGMLGVKIFIDDNDRIELSLSARADDSDVRAAYMFTDEDAGIIPSAEEAAQMLESTPLETWQQLERRIRRAQPEARPRWTGRRERDRPRQRSPRPCREHGSWGRRNRR